MTVNEGRGSLGGCEGGQRNLGPGMRAPLQAGKSKVRPGACSRKQLCDTVISAPGDPGWTSDLQGGKTTNVCCSAAQAKAICCAGDLTLSCVGAGPGEQALWPEGLGPALKAP